MKQDDQPCWREAKAWAEDQESGDEVAAWLIVLFIVASALGWLLV